MENNQVVGARDERETRYAAGGLFVFNSHHLYMYSSFACNLLFDIHQTCWIFVSFLWALNIFSTFFPDILGGGGCLGLSSSICFTTYLLATLLRSFSSFEYPVCNYNLVIFWCFRMKRMKIHWSRIRKTILLQICLF